MKQSYTRVFIIPILLSLLLLIQGCKQNLVPEIHPSKGTLDLLRYISIGDSYSAGVSNTDFSTPSLRGLYEEAQAFSFPQLLAEQFQIIEPIYFEQPILEGNGSGYLKLASYAKPKCDLAIPTPKIEKQIPRPGWYYPPSPSRSINNYGTPNLRSTDLFNDSLYFQNPFFSRLSPDLQSSYGDLLSALNPTFFTLWLGQEDLLPYALSGGTQDELKPVSASSFGNEIHRLLISLLINSPNTQGVIANIPDITDFPYFSTVGPEYISQDECQQSPRSIYIETSSGTTRKASNLDLILLPAAEIIGKDYMGLTPEKPIPNHLVLDAFEAAGIRNTISLYNTQLDSLIETINQQMENSRFVLADMYGLFKKLRGGYTIAGLEVSSEYLSGGIFSLDGVYLTPRGNAMVANEFINVINKNRDFSAIIPTINITDYPGVVFP